MGMQTDMHANRSNTITQNSSKIQHEVGLEQIIRVWRGRREEREVGKRLKCEQIRDYSYFFKCKRAGGWSIQPATYPHFKNWLHSLPADSHVGWVGWAQMTHHAPLLVILKTQDYASSLIQLHTFTLHDDKTFRLVHHQFA